jgi:ketosteroid isomerase-like protein
VARAVEETLAIHELVVRYGFLIDDRAWDAFDEVFTEDAVVDFRLPGTEPPTGAGPLIGRDEIVRQFRDVMTHPHQHMLVSHLIDDVADGEVVVRSKALLPMPGGSIVDLLYRDVVVRTPLGWRIRHKSIQMYPLHDAELPAARGGRRAGEEGAT